LQTIELYKTGVKIRKNIHDRLRAELNDAIFNYLDVIDDCPGVP